jgi:hypothetical protein
MNRTPMVPCKKNIVLMFIACLLIFFNCGDTQECKPPVKSDTSHFPRTLSMTGISDDNVQAYEPQFELWSDGASKNRWILLPENSRIDTSNMDLWEFPEGTKLWKEFQIDGKKIETRILEKIGTSREDWSAVAYLWNDDQTEAFIAVDGAEDVKGTTHDVPTAGQCFGCHGGRPNRVLGFSAIQLAHTNADGLDMSNLIELDLLTNPPESSITVPGTNEEKSALGYLHANCSHCHNKENPAPDNQCFNPQRSFSFLLKAATSSVTTSQTYTTAIDKVIKSGKASSSDVIKQMAVREDDNGMPPLGTEKVDNSGLSLIRAWINNSL